MDVVQSTHFYLCHVGKFMLRYILCLEEMCIGAVGFILGQFCKFLLQSLPLLDIF